MSVVKAFLIVECMCKKLTEQKSRIGRRSTVGKPSAFWSGDIETVEGKQEMAGD